MFGPGRARREQPNGGLHLGVRAFVRSVSHAKVLVASLFGLLQNIASHAAATPSSHRANEPPSARAPGKLAHLARTGPNGHSRRTARMRCPDIAVFRLSPPLVARPLTALGHSQWSEPPGFADAPATSPAAVEELTPSRDPTPRPLRASPRRPSVTLPPATSLHAIVRCGDTPALQSPDDRRERHKRDPHLGPSASQPPKPH